MSLITTTTEMRSYLRMSLSEKEVSWLPFVAPAIEKYIRPVLGDDLLEELEADYALDDNHDTELEKLLPYVQAPLAKFTLFLAVPNLDLTISEGGFTVTSTPQQAPASRERVLALQGSLENQGWDAIETLLRYLEENCNNYESIYQTWKTSDAYTLAIRNLVNSAREFDKIFNIAQSRILFNRYRTAMDDADLLHIKRAIGADMFDALIEEIRSGTISGANQKILPLLQRAEVLFAVSDSPDKARDEGVGVEINTAFMRNDIEAAKYKAGQYLCDALVIMKATPDDYPQYSDSDAYQAAETRFENNKDNKIFVFGGTN